MNYRHAFHAGNFADVFKHLVLVVLLDLLTAKDRPLFFLDTHAGRGRYDLDAASARHSGEADRGVRRIAALHGLQADLQRYLGCVRAADAANAQRIRWYPGSPSLAAALLRPSDRIALCELEPGEASVLRREFAGDRRVAVHRRDGYEALQALLPPAERRALALIDPPYEAQEQEFDQVAEALAGAQRHWPQGVYAAWYPIKRAATAAAFGSSLTRLGVSRLLVAELSVHPADNEAGLNGSGLALLNPPWRLDERLASALPALHAALAPDGAGGTRLEWLAPA